MISLPDSVLLFFKGLTTHLALLSCQLLVIVQPHHGFLDVFSWQKLIKLRLVNLLHNKRRRINANQIVIRLDLAQIHRLIVMNLNRFVGQVFHPGHVLLRIIFMGALHLKLMGLVLGLCNRLSQLSLLHDIEVLHLRHLNARTLIKTEDGLLNGGIVQRRLHGRLWELLLDNYWTEFLVGLSSCRDWTLAICV